MGKLGLLSSLSTPVPQPSSWTDRALSISAAVAAIAAVAVSVYQAHLSREQQRASAWPYVTEWNSFGDGRPYTRTAENAGIGPALVRSVQVLADGEPQPTWGATVERLTGLRDSSLVYTSSFGRGSVLPAGQDRLLLTIQPGPVAERFFVAAQERLSTRVCYCSVYDECWMADSRADGPEPVGTCRVDPETEFQQ